jgi:glycosyltransferase involved in cell wall biosynthesis
MKILIVLPYFKNESAGTITYVNNLVSAYPEIDFCLAYVSTSIDLINQNKNVKLLPLKELSFMKKKGLSITLDFRELIKELKTSDIVHSHGLWLFMNILIGYLTYLTNTKHIISVHGFLTKWSRNNKMILKIFLLIIGQFFSLIKSSIIHVTNDFELNDLPWYINKHKLALVDNIPPAPQKLESNIKETNTMGFISRIHPKKGLLELLTFYSKNSDLPRLLVAGPVEDKKYFEQCNILINSMPNVSYIGPVFGVDKNNFYKKISTLIFPTHSENYGYVVPEALSFGTRVLVTENSPWFVYSEDLSIKSYNTVEELLNLIKTSKSLNIRGRKSNSISYFKYFNSIDSVKKLKQLYVNVITSS